MKRFQALWEQCAFQRAGPAAEEGRRPTRAGHRLDSFFLNSPLVPWAVRERPHLAPGWSPASLGSDHGPVVLDIPLAVVSRVTGVRMPSGMDPQYPYGQAGTEASLAQVRSD